MPKAAPPAATDAAADAAHADDAAAGPVAVPPDAAAELPDVPGEAESEQEFPVPGEAEVPQSQDDEAAAKCQFCFERLDAAEPWLIWVKLCVGSFVCCEVSEVCTHCVALESVAAAGGRSTRLLTHLPHGVHSPIHGSCGNSKESSLSFPVWGKPWSTGRRRCD